ncbi:MAG TPA: hypothetical protein VF203_07700 [Burkholderiales bacterium]
MELKDFIKTTLVEIVRGIEEADSELEGSSARVNPPNMMGTSGHMIVVPQPEDGPLSPFVEKIEFDVAVFAKEGNQTQGGLGIMVGSIGIGGKSKAEGTSGSESRIKFSVPVMFPQSKR